MKCARLEQELRKSKRREEKLTALQYRLKEDVRLMGSDARSKPSCLPVVDTAICLQVLLPDTGCCSLSDQANSLSDQANSRMTNTCCTDAHRRLCLPVCLHLSQGDM